MARCAQSIPFAKVAAAKEGVATLSDLLSVGTFNYLEDASFLVPSPFAKSERSPSNGYANRPTLGCTCAQNEDVVGLVNTIIEFQKSNPDVPIPYLRE